MHSVLFALLVFEHVFERVFDYRVGRKTLPGECDVL